VQCLGQKRLTVSGLDVPPIAGVGARRASSGIDWGAHLHPQVLGPI
jgi:hypothetical protein